MNYKEYRDATIKDLFNKTFEALATILIIQALGLVLLLVASVLTSVPISSDFPRFVLVVTGLAAWCVIGSVLLMLKSLFELIRATFEGKRILNLVWYYHKKYKNKSLKDSD